MKRSHSPLSSSSLERVVGGFGSGNYIVHTEMARRLGVPVSLIRKLWRQGAFPSSVEVSSKWICIPYYFHLAAIHFGLQQVVKWKDEGWFPHYTLTPDRLAKAINEATSRMIVSAPNPLTLTETKQIAEFLGRRMIRHTEFARALGVSAKVVRRCYMRGGLPGSIAHSANVIMIPSHLLRLAGMYGLRVVETWSKCDKIGGDDVFRH